MAISSSSASPGANADYITLNGTSSISPTTDRVLVYDPSTDSLRMHRIGQSITGLKRRRDHFDDVEVEDSSHPRHQKRKLNKLINKGKKKKVRKDKNEQPKEDIRNDDNDIGNGDDADAGGSDLASGIYMVKLVTDRGVVTNKVTLLK